MNVFLLFSLKNYLVSICTVKLLYDYCVTIYFINCLTINWSKRMDVIFCYILCLISSFSHIPVKSSVSRGDLDKISTFTCNGQRLDAQRGAQVWFSSSAKKVSRRYRDPTYITVLKCLGKNIKVYYYNIYFIQTNILTELKIKLWCCDLVNLTM